jgi:hypothetical protein
MEDEWYETTILRESEGRPAGDRTGARETASAIHRTALPRGDHPHPLTVEEHELANAMAVIMFYRRRLSLSQTPSSMRR